MSELLAILSKVFTLIPYVVAGINTIHAEKNSATKAQMAQDALNVATQGALAVLPSSDTATAQAVSAAVATGIQSVQAVHDALNGTTEATQSSVPVSATQAALAGQTAPATVLG